MSELKNKLIKIAYENPELRAELLPIIESVGMSHEAGAINNFFRGMTGRPSEPKVQEELRNFRSNFTSDFQKKLKPRQALTCFLSIYLYYLLDRYS